MGDNKFAKSLMSFTIDLRRLDLNVQVLTKVDTWH